MIFAVFQVFSFKTPFAVEEMFGGHLLGLRSSEFICFYDWLDYRLIRRVDICPTLVVWSESDILMMADAGENFTRFECSLDLHSF